MAIRVPVPESSALNAVLLSTLYFLSSILSRPILSRPALIRPRYAIRSSFDLLSMFFALPRSLLALPQLASDSPCSVPSWRVARSTTHRLARETSSYRAYHRTRYLLSRLSRLAMIDSGLHPSSTALGPSILPEISFLPAAFRFQPLFVLCSLSLIASCALFIVSRLPSILLRLFALCLLPLRLCRWLFTPSDGRCTLPFPFPLGLPRIGVLAFEPRSISSPADTAFVENRRHCADSRLPLRRFSPTNACTRCALQIKPNRKH